MFYYQLIVYGEGVSLHVFRPCLNSQIGLWMTGEALSVSMQEHGGFYKGFLSCSFEYFPPTTTSLKPHLPVAS